MKGVFLGLVLPIFVVGWWDVGHMLAAAVAEKKLKKENPYAAAHFQELIQSINQLTDNRSHTLVESACWPDDLKGRSYNMQLWNSWHFINKLYVPDGTFVQLNFTNVAVNSLEAIHNAVRALSSNMNHITAERALFARYLVHVVGDIHQPLHSVALYNDTYPGGDLGGNKLKVVLTNGSTSNFHSFWDAGAYRVQNDSWFIVRPMDEQNRTALSQVASAMMDEFDAEIQELGKELDPAVWIQESFEVCKNFTYPYVEKTNQLNEAYTNEAYQISKKRITLAGYRIANLVIDIYEKEFKGFLDNVATKWEKMKLYVQNSNKKSVQQQ